MGQDQSKKHPGFTAPLFSPESQDKLNAIFVEASSEESKCCSISSLEGVLSRVLHPAVSRTLCLAMTATTSAGDPNESTVEQQQFVSTAGQLLKSSPDQLSLLLMSIMSSQDSHHKTPALTTAHIKLYIQRMLTSFMALVGGKRSTPPSAELLERISVTLLDELNQQDDSVALNQSVVEKWLMRTSLFSAVQISTFRCSLGLDIPRDYRHLLPELRQPDNHQPLLAPLETVFLNWALPYTLRNRWRLLFSSSLHGESYSSMLKRITDCGPTLLMIRESQGGRVFGGFAPVDWHCSGNFFGSHESFLFSTTPTLQVYNSTGFNDNYMYINVGQETLPNGLGFGGKFGYFGLMLCAEFGDGFTAPSCTTFGCRLLSGDKRFHVEELQVWGVGDEPVKQSTVRPSVLDADPESAAMLEMIQGGMRSAGLRDTPTADSPGDKQLPPL